jgi:hypothetical protein
MVGTRLRGHQPHPLHDFPAPVAARRRVRVTRDAAEAGTAAAREELFAEAARTRSPKLGDDQRSRKRRGDEPGPQLVIATTANINANRGSRPAAGGSAWLSLRTR